MQEERDYSFKIVFRKLSLKKFIWLYGQIVVNIMVKYDKFCYIFYQLKHFKNLYIYTSQMLVFIIF